MGPSGADAYMIIPRGTERVEEGQQLAFFRI
ncbi:MAG: hypothetical protein ACYS8K_02670 [Planctomycetota bacterium]